MEWPTGPWNQVVRYMNVGYAQGNVPTKTGSPSDIYEGPNPPPNDAIRALPALCMDVSVIAPPQRHLQGKGVFQWRPERLVALQALAGVLRPESTAPVARLVRD